MKELKDYKEVIHKCSKCGLCQSVCPTYLETGNECCVSRGQFVMLKGVINGDLKLNKNINKYLDTCLKCGKCSSFCPSGIDIVEVILSAKSEYFKNSAEGKIISVFQSKPVFNTILSLFKIFKSNKKFNQIFPQKAIYFGGCVENIYPKTTDYIKTLLNKMKIQILDTDFGCCGLPFLTSGNTERFIEQVKENTEKLKDLDFDYFVTDCASCQWAWMEYIKYVENDDIKNKLSKIKFVSIYDLIEENNIEFELKKKLKVTYHTPCHGECENIIKRIKNIDYVESDNKEDCCGFALLFKPSTWNVAKKIRHKKRENILKTNADFILTNCVACVISLSLLIPFRKKVMRVMDFLSRFAK